MLTAWCRRVPRRTVMRGGDRVRTDQRLTEAYSNASVIEIDRASRIVIMSDAHRGDGSRADEFTRNQNAFLHALNHYYAEGFTYVEAGDGDELWEHPRFRYIKDAHHDVFEIIQRFFMSQRFIILWGNHNVYLKDPAYVKDNYFTYSNPQTEVTTDFLPDLTPVEALRLRCAGTGQEILVIHGHQGDFYNDQFWFVTMLSMKYTWRIMHAFGLQNPASPAKNAYKRHKIEKNYNKWIEKHKRALICGHTHRFKFPRNGELPYFNTGSCVYPASITAIEIAEGEIALVRWHVTPDSDGHLQVQRQVLSGPDPLASFDIR